eukprot:jgi/Mesen1/7071/ME000369S06400
MAAASEETKPAELAPAAEAPASEPAAGGSDGPPEAPPAKRVRTDAEGVEGAAGAAATAATVVAAEGGEAQADTTVLGTDDKDNVKSGAVQLGYKEFSDAIDMFTFFYDLLHRWTVNQNINEYEHHALVDLISKGHYDPASKIGAGIKAFQVRDHPEHLSRCYFILRSDGSVDDFSFRKCVDKLMPLPSDYMPKPHGRREGGRGGNRGRGRFGGGGGGGYRGRGRGGGGRRGGRR